MRNTPLKWEISRIGHYFNVEVYNFYNFEFLFGNAFMTRIFKVVAEFERECFLGTGWHTLCQYLILDEFLSASKVTQISLVLLGICAVFAWLFHTVWMPCWLSFYFLYRLDNQENVTSSAFYVWFFKLWLPGNI